MNLALNNEKESESLKRKYEGLSALEIENLEKKRKKY
jgi:hypothetical protein